MEQIWQDYQDETFAQIGVDAWDGRSGQVDATFRLGTGTTYPLLLMGSRIARQYGFDRHNYMVVDHEGIVRYRSSGGISRRFDDEAIRTAIKETMAKAPAMEFPVEWHVIEGHRVVYYPWQVFPDPHGGDAVYRFGCVTILEYAGEGLWSYQEDLYNPKEGEKVVQRWLADGGKLATQRGESV